MGKQIQVESMKKSPRYYIGIDPGIVSGIAVWDSHKQTFLSVESMMLYKIFNKLSESTDIIVFIENPNTWVPFRNVSPTIQQMRRAGAGAVKQTYKHIIEFLEGNHIQYRASRIQKGMKKLSAARFFEITKFEGTTNEHGRDAAMLVFKR